MRWIWIDKFKEFNSGKNAVAVKNISLAEEHLHDHFQGFPVMPECLMIEGMAQTAGLLVGEHGGFKEKVILAKVNKAEFYDYARPGETIEHHAELVSFAPEAASAAGKVYKEGNLLAEINLMFSHLDNNMSNKRFPEENFVFTEMFEWLMRDYHARVKLEQS
ncbi:3-hydroxyacyl-ACP dehydratase FabZ family protein [Sedimentisphaera salicampi]|uniref:3-hydroxyacyl-[acyl-carrier-protein] dehydratase FabZ n=1 Tax=Sedimentisphaera salicampi TaxID=1941349 RepID=A0A1W6LQ59_9BACT|nr:3-hydroxyacyl-ACP dehydratase FabZ family protein [Sedimentisphaera salicampi]ARN57910.1 3-hydroxyacyl-[acyl-carrier-protein] dehydratase FabZ [Sedimentisphaera salicampi]